MFSWLAFLKSSLTWNFRTTWLYQSTLDNNGWGRFAIDVRYYGTTLTYAARPIEL